MKTILVVDDNSELRYLTAEALRSYGFNVIEAENGESGLEVLRNVTVDLIFTDVIMPGRIRSVDMVQQAKENLCTKVKVLYTSGYPIVDQTLVGDAEMISKPYNIDDLRCKLNEMLIST